MKKFKSYILVIQVFKMKDRKKNHLWLPILIALICIAGIATYLTLKRIPKQVKLFNLTYTLKDLTTNQIISEENLITNSEGLKQVLDSSIADKIDWSSLQLEPGQAKEILIEKPYGVYDENKVVAVSRVQSLNRSITLSRIFNLSKDSFVDLVKEQPLLNHTYSIGNEVYKVIDLDNDTVILQLQLELNEVTHLLPLPFFIEQKVKEFNETDFTLWLDGNDTEQTTEWGKIRVEFKSDKIEFIVEPELNASIELQGVSGRVKGFNETHVFIDQNNPYAGHNFELTLQVHSYVTKELKTEKVKFDLFIMSYCPFGLQAVKGVLPLLKDPDFEKQVDFNLRFVSYTMHGEQEEIENKRIICIREEQPKKLTDYLECFTSGAKDCLDKAGIDKESLQECMEKRAASYLEEDAKLNELYKVQGSPTYVINGKQVQVWPRSPANLVKEICKYMQVKQGICLKSYPTENPSPGFGLGTSNQGGHC